MIPVLFLLARRAALRRAAVRCFTSGKQIETSLGLLLPLILWGVGLVWVAFLGLLRRFFCKGKAICLMME